MNDVRPLPPHVPDDDGLPQPVRFAWWTLVGVLVLFPLAGLILLVIPQPWKALLVFVLLLFFLALVRRLVQLSRTQRKR